MATVLPLPDTLSARANALFDSHIAQTLANKDPQDFVAIDVETGDYEVDPEEVLASTRLRARQPRANIFVRRVGDECAYEITAGFLG